VEVVGIGGGRKRTTPPTTMDYHNDEEWQAYYANMMIQNSPDDASLSEHSGLSSPENNHGRGIGNIHSSNVSYETDDDDDDDEQEKTPPPPAPKKKIPPKKKRDPNMPKGALTANLLYANANRARAKEEVSEIDTHLSLYLDPYYYLSLDTSLFLLH
jgi:hypothetical protein